MPAEGHPGLNDDFNEEADEDEKEDEDGNGQNQTITISYHDENILDQDHCADTKELWFATEGNLYFQLT